MKELAPGLWQLRGFPPNAVNVYLADDVLIDASTRQAGWLILRELRGRKLRAHALTHAHPDHQGSSHTVCTKLGIPYWVGARDADAAERPELIGERQPDHWIAQLYDRLFTGPGHPVDREISEGDEVAGFQVLEVPGHSVGHLAFWRESDRVLILGDVLTNMDVLTLIPGLHEPKPYLTPDPKTNRRSAKRLGALAPDLVLFGHGPPLRDRRKFVEFVERLPAE